MTALPKLLDELDALYERATKGPWVDGPRSKFVIRSDADGSTVAHVFYVPNADLIRALVNAYPALRAAARDAERANACIREMDKVIQPSDVEGHIALRKKHAAAIDAALSAAKERGDEG